MEALSHGGMRHECSLKCSRPSWRDGHRKPRRHFDSDRGTRASIVEVRWKDSDRAADFRFFEFWIHFGRCVRIQFLSFRYLKDAWVAVKRVFDKLVNSVLFRLQRFFRSVWTARRTAGIFWTPILQRKKEIFKFLILHFKKLLAKFILHFPWRDETLGMLESWAPVFRFDLLLCRCPQMAWGEAVLWQRKIATFTRNIRGHT